MAVDFGNPYKVLNDVWDQTARALRTTASLTLDSAGIATSTNQTDGSQKTQIVDSGGEAVTVTGGKLDVNASVDTTGLATSAKQDTIIGHLDGVETSLSSIDTKTPALGQALAAASVPVVLTAAQLTTLTPPAAITGYATSAKQDTIIGHLDGVEGLLTTIDADTGNISTKIDTLAGAVSGTEMQVDVLTMPTVTVNSHHVTNAGTFAVQVDGAALTSLQLIDDIIYTDDTSTHSTGTSKGALFMAAATPTDGSVNANDIGAVAMTTDRKLHVSVQDSIPAGTNAIGKLAANSGVDIGDVDITSISAGDNVIGRFKLTDGTDVADVLDLTNSNPLTVAIVDSNGDQISSFGGGTQYTEDAAAAANPVGTAPILIRTDTPATQVTTDGDNIAQRGTNYGAAYVQLVTSGGAYIDSVGGGTEYSEDAATPATQVGKAIMMERDDALSAVTPIEGDWIGLRGSAEGALWTQDFNSDAILADTTAIKTAVETIDNAIAGSEMQVDVVTSALPTGASTLAEQQSQTTHLATIAGDTTAIETAVQLIDDTVATLGTTTYTEAATKGLIIGAVRRDADTTLVDTTNEIGPLQMDARGFLKTEVFSGETLPVSLTSTTITGTVAVTQSGTWDEVGINDSGNSITVDNNGTFVTQVDGAALTALQLIDDVVYTDDTSTHSTGTSKGVGMMGVAVPTDTSISANDIGMVGMSTDRRLYGDVTLQVADTDVSTTNPVPTKGVPSDIDINGSNANHAQKYYTNAGAVTDGIIWSPAAGKRWHVLTLYINVSAAATVTLEDDLAGGDSAVWKGELAANSGVVLTYDKEHPFSSTEDAADLIITTTAGNVYVQAVGYEV